MCAHVSVDQDARFQTGTDFCEFLFLRYKRTFERLPKMTS